MGQAPFTERSAKGRLRRSERRNEGSSPSLSAIRLRSRSEQEGGESFGVTTSTRPTSSASLRASNIRRAWRSRLRGRLKTGRCGCDSHRRHQTSLSRPNGRTPGAIGGRPPHAGRAHTGPSGPGGTPPGNAGSSPAFATIRSCLLTAEDVWLSTRRWRFDSSRLRHFDSADFVGLAQCKHWPPLSNGRMPGAAGKKTASCARAINPGSAGVRPPSRGSVAACGRGRRGFDSPRRLHESRRASSNRKTPVLQTGDAGATPVASTNLRRRTSATSPGRLRLASQPSPSHIGHITRKATVGKPTLSLS